jgi:hypothetical protein
MMQTASIQSGEEPMATNVLIADYNKNRIESLKGLIETRLGSSDYVVFTLLTNAPAPIGQKYNLDHNILSQIKLRNYSLLLGHMAGNPSGEDCLKMFKGYNSKGRAMFYTKRDKIGIDEFERFKLANKIFRRSDNDEVIFDDPNKMIEDIQIIMKERGIDYAKSILENKPVVAAGLGMLTAIIALGGTVLKLLLG